MHMAPLIFMRLQFRESTLAFCAHRVYLLGLFPVFVLVFIIFQLTIDKIVVL